MTLPSKMKKNPKRMNMTNVNKTVAERLRDMANGKGQYPGCELLASVATGSARCRQDANTCTECKGKSLKDLADMIEAEQAELRERVDECNNTFIDLAALDLLCDKLECGDANHRATAAQIRKAINGAKPQLPDGIEWPRFEDGELVKIDHDFMNAIWDKNGPDSWVVTSIEFESSGKAIIRAKDEFGKDCDKIELNRGERVKRPETEVLDADGVPIKVGDTVWNISTGKKYEVLKLPRKGSYQSVMVRGEDGADGFDPDRLTQRKPDTKESVRAEIIEAVKADYAVNLLPLFERYEQVALRKAGE